MAEVCVLTAAEEFENQIGDRLPVQLKLGARDARPRELAEILLQLVKNVHPRRGEVRYDGDVEIGRRVVVNPDLGDAEPSQVVDHASIEGDPGAKQLGGGTARMGDRSSHLHPRFETGYSA